MTGVIPQLTGVKDLVDEADHFVATVAILLGGAWAYLQFVRGRVFTSRLEPAIEGKLVAAEGRQITLVKVTVRNVGLTKVDIDRDLTTIEVFSYPAQNYFPEFHNALLDQVGIVRALTSDAWIEPGECIVEQRVIALPPTPVLALQLKLKILRKRRVPWVRGVEWNAEATVLPDLQPATDQQASRPTHRGIWRRQGGRRSGA